MTRLIDANALKIAEFIACRNDYAKGWNDAVEAIVKNAPTVDAAPSEKLNNFIREIGAITYGKERFFYEDVGVWRDLWYDRKSCEWITTQAAIEECLKAVRELDDGDIDAVQHGKWILNEVQDDEENANDNFSYRCSCCGYSDLHAKNQTVPYCWHCGARMDKEDDTKRD